MAAKMYSSDRWDTYCSSCGTQDTPLKLNTEPLDAGPTIALRDLHNRTFHPGEKMTNHVPFSVWIVTCDECGAEEERLVVHDYTDKRTALAYRNQHNAAFHGG